MIYRNSEIDSNYDKVAEISDNYIVWVRETRLENNRDYNAYIQFFNPSFFYYFTNSYRVKYCDNVVYVPHYNNSGMYSYIDYYEVVGTLDTTTLTSGDDFSTSNDFRADFPHLFVMGFLTCCVVIWTFKQLSRLFYKGGLG